MKAFVQGTKISVQAIAGTHVVVLGLNATETGRKGLIGFGISRKDEDTQEIINLKGTQHFENGNVNADSMTNPIQSFLWGDYTTEPEKTYTYTVIPFYGNPALAQKESAVQVRVAMEDNEHQTHAVHFNRGVAGSQHYSNKFGQYRKYYLMDNNGREQWEECIKPDEVPGNEAWKWLSRGLEEAMLQFIRQADGSEYSIRASIYELTYSPVLEAFAEAMENGVDVKIVHHSKTTKTTVVKKDGNVVVEGLDEVGEAAKEAIYQIGIRKKENTRKWTDVFIRRTNAQISHNKFIVLLKNNQPIQVWTGSTNLTSGGIFGQSNVGHVVRDSVIAGHYLDYWTALSSDPKLKTGKEGEGISNWNVDYQKDLVGDPDKNSITTIFSPRLTIDMLQWYAQRIGVAKSSIHFTAAFGVCPEIGTELVTPPTETPDNPVMRQVLLESKPSQKQSEKQKADAQKAGKPIPLDYYDFIKLWNNQVAYGDLLANEYLTGLNTNVDYLHTKYLLVDPLTDNPLVITGSANFSKASTISNDENMLVISGNTSVADIYLSEFVRLFQHFRNRNIVNGLTPQELEKAVLLSTDDSWTNKYYEEGASLYGERLLFGTKKSDY